MEVLVAWDLLDTDDVELIRARTQAVVLQADSQ